MIGSVFLFGVGLIALGFVGANDLLGGALQNTWFGLKERNIDPYKTN